MLGVVVEWRLYQREYVVFLLLNDSATVIMRFINLPPVNSCRLGLRKLPAMIITAFYRPSLICVWLFIICGCVAQPSLLQQDLTGNKQLLEEQQWALWQQTEKLDEMATTQEAFYHSLKNIALSLDTLQALAKQRALKNVEALTEPLEPPKEKPKTISLMASTEEVSKAVVGRNEWVWFDLLGQALKSRVDTGALSSALNATGIQPFERNGDKWVSFALIEGQSAPRFEAPLLRYVRIRQSSTKKLDRRPVIKLRVRVGDMVEETPFTLNDRDSMIYPVLLGREFLRDVMVVDVSKKFTQSKYQPELKEKSE